MEQKEHSHTWLSRFRRWQEHPVEYRRSSEEHVCRNCGNTFSGHYCPTCGQKASAGTFTWQSVRQGVMDIWGLGTRSLPYSLWQLAWRPGHFVRDYISGKLQVSFPPVKMLVIVALVAQIVQFFLGKLNPSFVVVETESTEEGFLGWFERMLEVDQWAVVFLASFFIVPTWVVFRYAPRISHHTLPQNFFIQILCGTQLLVFGYLFVGAAMFLHGKEVVSSATSCYMFCVVPLVYLMDYKQLFGYGWWGTVWRLAMAILAAVSLMVGVVGLVYSCFGSAASLQEFASTIMLLAIFLFWGYFFLVLADYLNQKLWREQGLGMSVLRLLIKMAVPLLLLSVCFALFAYLRLKGR